MRICTYCGKEYADDALICSVDHEPLRADGFSASSKGKETSAWQRAFKLKTILQAGAWICFLQAMLLLAGVLDDLIPFGWSGWRYEVWPTFMALVSFLLFLGVVYPKLRLPEKCFTFDARFVENLFIFVVFFLETIALWYYFGPDMEALPILMVLCLPVLATACYLTTLVCRFAHRRHWHLKWYLGLVGPVLAGFASLAFVWLGFSFQHGGWGEINVSPWLFWLCIIGSTLGIIPSEFVLRYYRNRIKDYDRVA